MQISSSILVCDMALQVSKGAEVSHLGQVKILYRGAARQTDGRSPPPSTYALVAFQLNAPLLIFT